MVISIIFTLKYNNKLKKNEIYRKKEVNLEIFYKNTF